MAPASMLKLGRDGDNRDRCPCRRAGRCAAAYLGPRPGGSRSRAPRHGRAIGHVDRPGLASNDKVLTTFGRVEPCGGPHRFFSYGDRGSP